MNSIENINGVKTPLAYQLTEYDCAQATFLNAMRFLLNRNEIPPVNFRYCWRAWSTWTLWYI